MDVRPPGEFEKAAQQHNDGGVVRELWLFLRDNKKWWLLPILVVLLLFGLLVLLSGSGAAPFIYTLF
jgi:drug/metabolite transporter superfamily protein YnfA